MIQRTPGVLYYRRYVDDIIVIAPSKSSFSIPDLEELLPTGLKFAPEKTYDIIENPPNGGSCTNTFDYLGYRFDRSLAQKKRRYDPKVLIGISDKKLDRLEARIRLVGREFRRDQNYRDLTGRLRMLTGNYFIKKAGHPKPIPVGIYFNYPKLDDFSGLDRLDKALQDQMISLRLYSRKSGLPTSALKGLMKYSFKMGHNRRIKHRFSVSDIRKFRSAWAYG